MASFDNNSHLDGYLCSLRTTTFAKLSNMLNPTKVLLTDDGHLRDWRGLAELMGCDMLVIQNLEKTSNPFAGLISQVKDLTANQLIEYLEKMDRYDVVDDTIALMENDLYLASRQTNLQETKQDIPQIVTIGDQEQFSEDGTLVQYDAFVLYAREDQEFVNTVVKKIEGEYGMKLCLKDRDFIAGLPFEHQAVTELISNRCRFVLPIFSPNFLNSEDNKFVVNFSEALGIERGCRKIVPCVYQQCDLPKSVRYYTRLDFTRQNPYWDFWDKMKKSLADPSAPPSERTDKINISTTENNTEQKYPARLSPKGDLSEKSKSYPENVPATCSKSSSSGEQKENKLLHEEVVQEMPERGRETKHWLKKMWKKSKKKSVDKQKVKVLAF
ncbi:myeloid differentiation primary response protein MyD88-like [Daphnia pulicaria]|uniref:myeloid differentiation primary response protein MyD88-like n=1 Tax=Daphnia pulicaria TaxID=35523 RepID=UPI001EEB6F58|nr:myeloid differentiation primary response protein MyD88-like [Daphnia pulicaria]